MSDGLFESTKGFLDPAFPAKPDPALSLIEFCQKHFGQPVGTISVKHTEAIERLMGGMLLSSASEQKVLRAHHAMHYEYVYSETLRGHVRIGERV